MHVFVQAWKSTVVVNLLFFVACALMLALTLGYRLPVGAFGVSLLSDPGGRPYVVIDHTSARGWLLGFDAHHRRIQAWEGTIRFQ